jgi:hypothetical protein
MVPAQEKSVYPLKNGRPTSKGIDLYVTENADALIMELQDFIGDTLFNANIYTEDLSQNGDQNPLELGNYYPNEIFINNAEIFLAYELEALSKTIRDSINTSNLFVKTAVFHELMHHYVYQVSLEMLRREQIGVDRAYQTFFRIYSNRDDPGSRFIEEGICEYVTLKMKARISPRRPPVPKTIAELKRPENEYNVFYRYATYCLTEFLDTQGLKRGIKILLHNPPPTDEEMLDMDLYFDRLNGIDQAPSLPLVAGLPDSGIAD